MYHIACGPGEGYGGADGSRELAGAAVRCAGRASELAGKCALSEGSQHLPCAEPRQAGLASGALKRGGSSRLGSGLGLGAALGGAVLGEVEYDLYGISGVVSGVTRRNRFCSARGTARRTLRSRSAVVACGIAGALAWSREACGLWIGCGARKCGR